MAEDPAASSSQKASDDVQSGYDERRFSSLSALLSLRSGGQDEQPTIFDDREPEAPPVDGPDRVVTEIDFMSVLDTSIVSDAEKASDTMVERAFLDRLAELLSTSRGEVHVACTALVKTSEGCISIFAARSGGLRSDDQFLAIIEKWLLDRVTDADMWNKILSFYHKRIQTYATHLHTLLESFPRVNEDEDEDLKCLMELRTHCRVANNQERRDSIVKIATKLRNSEQLRTLLHGSFFSDGIKIWKAICFLARTNSFFTTFIEFRQKFGRFRQVRVVGLKDMQAKKKAEPASSFDNALKSFGLQPNSSVAKKYFGTPNLKELRKRFNVIQLQPLYSHVEIQLICYLMRERLSERTIPYIGCSKRSCLICWNFLKHLPGAFRTRGCHGKLYNRWTVPKISNPNTADQISINTALGSVQRELQKIVLLPASPIDPVPNPAIVMSASNEANSAASNELPPLLKLLMEKIPERERQAKIHKLFFGTSKVSDEELAYDAASRTEELVGECFVCDQPTSRHCSHCQEDWFCSNECELQASAIHKIDCGREPLDSADKLEVALARDLLPDDPDVCQDYGFDRFLGGTERSKLLGLYQGLYLSGICAATLREWKRTRTLEENIINHYMQIPERNRGGYFPWFMTVKDDIALDSGKKHATPDNHLERLLGPVRPFLSAQDRDTPAGLIKPRSKLLALVAFSGFLQGLRPGPDMPELYDGLGFCGCCMDEFAMTGSEAQLGSMYQYLVTGKFDNVPRHLNNGQPRPATFYEFWDAYEKKKMLQLLDSKGFKTFRAEFPHLPSALQHPEWTVWSLRKFLLSDEGNACPRSITADYGFIRCRPGTKDEADLKEVYKRLWDTAGPEKMHHAVLGRKLYQLAEEHAPDIVKKNPPKYRRLVKTILG